MVGWSGDDEIALTAGSDFHIRLWDSRSGEILRFLIGHKDETFIISPHPIHPRLVMSAGHDGNLFLWDLQSAQPVFKHFNATDTNG